LLAPALSGGRVLDLGCSPGAWLQVACRELGPRDKGGLVLGVDIQVRGWVVGWVQGRVKG
jgi:23S rRNA U2552 (ribose-2'-O)-methylase RlmE/FtsJ